MRRMIFLTTILLAVALTGAFARQEQQQATRVFKMNVNGPEANVMFMGGDFLFEGKPVKGAPYSADSVNESIQTLADGNRIVQSFTSKVYRDSEGRTRRESNGLGPIGGPISYQFFGPSGGGVSVASNRGAAGAVAGWGVAGAMINSGGPGGKPVTFFPGIVISDPVAGVNYVLDPDTRTAQKMSVMKLSTQDPAIAEAVAKAKQEAAATGKGSVTVSGQGKTVVVNVNSGTGDQSTLAPVTESLGTGIIEGVECEGTRTTITIPAGQIGNELPIVITSERWYSPKLQTVVLSKRHDPRTGDVTFKLVGIDQSEPPASLFQVPADYTVVDMADKMKAVIKGKEENRQ